MKILVACEYSGTVRDAFAARGHEAWSCDILPPETPGRHHQGDVLEILDRGWDLMIAHPPCTHLASSGAAHFAKKRADGRQQQGVDFFMALAEADIPRVAIENPIGIMSSQWRKPDQIVHPYMFGEPVSKATCLWLKNLPPLFETLRVQPEWWTGKNGKRHSKWDYEISCQPHHLRGKLRSKTFQGIANAMATQWGDVLGDPGHTHNNTDVVGDSQAAGRGPSTC